MRQHFREVRPHLRKMRKQQAVLNQIIVDDPLNREALNTALKAIGQTHADIQASSNATFVQFVQELSHAERVAFVDRPKRSRSHHKRRPHRQNKSAPAVEQIDDSIDGSTIDHANN